MKRLSLAKATASLADYVHALQKQALVVTEAGKPIAALVPIEGMDWESLALGTNPQFIDLIERSRRSHEKEGGFSSEEIRREFGLPPYRGPAAKRNKKKPVKAHKKAIQPKRNGERDGG
jgi:hypothetical protein